MSQACIRWGTRAMCALLLSSTALTHEFWIEPDTHRAAKGKPLAVRLRVGERFAGEAYPRNPRHIERFYVVGPERTERVRGATGLDPAGTVQFARSGTYTLAYRSTRSRIELDLLERP